MPEQAVTSAEPTAQEKELGEVADEMLRLGYEKKREVMGDAYFDEIRAFYNFQPAIRTSNPSFRPKIMFPDLVNLVLQEANDITENSPLIYIIADTKRKKERETALRAQWQAGAYNFQFLKATIWALLAGTGFIQVRYNPVLYSGRGGVMVTAWSPENVIVDPWAANIDEAEYVFLRVRMTYDEIRRRFRTGWRLRPEVGITPNPSNTMGSHVGDGLNNQYENMTLPPGAMRTVEVTGVGRGAAMGNPIVDYIFLHDESRIKVEETNHDDESPFPKPDTVPKYPRGRLIVRCGSYKLYDGPNPYRRFPLLPLYGTPPVTGFWAPPPVRYVLTLQQLAETMTSQIVENAVRLNNGMIVINKSAGLNKDKIRGLPGEIIEVDGMEGKSAVNLLTPPPFGADLLSMPERLIDKMKENFGFSPQRMGQAGAGNISSNLMDTSIDQSTKLTALRARYYAKNVEDVASLVYGTMLDYQSDTAFPLVEPNQDLALVPWQGALPGELEGWDVVVDPASIKPFSRMARSKLGLMLRNMGAIDIKHLLEWVDAPDKEEIYKELQQEQMLAAAAADQKKARGKK